MKNSPNPEPDFNSSRRTFLNNGLAALTLTTFPFLNLISGRKRMGIAAASYAHRWRAEKEAKKYAGFSNSMDMLTHCQSIGAGGIQTSIRNWDRTFGQQIRSRREEAGLYLEGQVLLPKDKADLQRFELQVQQAKEAGISILRTVCLVGRRYETFKTLANFLDFKKQSYWSLEQAEPIVRRHGLKLAIENHKDWRISEMLELLRHIESPWIGITLDTGNNISLLEDPMAVVEAFAPYTMTLHFKDMALEEYEDGFLLSEVPLGQGFIDLKQIIVICEKHNPEVTYNLEMITRDPLKVPCLKDQYWATFNGAVSGREMAHTLASVRKHEPDKPLPRISKLNLAKKLALEEKNILKSFEYARAELGFS